MSSVEIQGQIGEVERKLRKLGEKIEKYKAALPGLEGKTTLAINELGLAKAKASLSSSNMSKNINSNNESKGVIGDISGYAGKINGVINKLMQERTKFKQKITELEKEKVNLTLQLTKLRIQLEEAKKAEYEASIENAKAAGKKIASNNQAPKPLW